MKNFSDTREVFRTALLSAFIFSLLLAPSAFADGITTKEAPLYSQDGKSSRAASAESLKGNASPRIVGGFPASISNYPWQVSLALNPDRFPGTPYERHFCGGALVTPTVVVSAAHCFYEYGMDDFYPASEHTAIVNRSTLNNSSVGQEIDFERYFYFVDDFGSPVYDPYTNDYDAVIIELKQPVVNARPISIAGDDEGALWSPGSEASASGWGATREGGAVVNQLQAVNINILPDWACGVYWEYNSDLQLCAGRMTGGKDTCQGDSGGPLTVGGADGLQRLVGLTSYGDGCARAKRPGAYARIASPALAGPIAAAFQEYGFGDPFSQGALAPSRTAAVITSFPKKSTKLGRKKRKKLSFRFLSSRADSNFRCKLYRNGRLAVNRSCPSPFVRKYRAGRYSLRVTAIKAGNQSAAPATYKFRVRR